MAGSNRSADMEQLDGPAIVLVEPQLGVNIGAAARAMWNFGLADMRLVAPRDGWPNPEAGPAASGADHVLERARVYPTTAEAVAEASYVYATTARPRELTKLVLTPEAAAADIVRRQAAGERVAVLFGRERTGLENPDVIAANAIVSVPTNPAFSSLNLAQCVLLLAAEIRRQGVAHERAVYETGETGLATRDAVDRLYAHLEEELDDAGYFWPHHKAEAMKASLRNLLSRTPMTDQDVRMMRGVVRSLSETRRRKLAEATQNDDGEGSAAG